MPTGSTPSHERFVFAPAPGKDPTAEDFLDSFEVSRVPAAPGCYLMLDAKGKTIYVGKAKSLRARIRTYINESDSRYSVKFLMRRVRQIDFLVTHNEKEALLLENSLIKQHRPRYNVQLKDDKTYTSLRIDVRQDFPRVTVVRRYKQDGAKYFGPYHSAGSMRKTLKQVHRLFPLRTCSDHVMNNRSRPCLYYQMKQCVAPCVGYVDRAQYHEIVNQVTMVLEGRSKELDKALTDRIAAHAEKLEFEEAAVLRDRLYDLRKTMERQQTVAVPGADDRDVFGLYTEGRYTEIQVIFYRGGKMLGGRSFSFERTEMPHDELLSSFLLQYYSEAAATPREVLVPIDLEEAETLAEILREDRGSGVTIHRPQRGAKAKLIALATRNAEQSFKEKRLAEKAKVDALEEMAKALSLDEAPKRIECFDISTMQGDKNVASMVVFTDGKPDKARYRRFSIKTVEGQDDFASMREVLMRRFQRAIDENDLPDFVLIDGGKGQLNVASAVFKDLGIEDLPRAGIAKARTQESGRTAERLFVPGRSNPIVLSQTGPVIQLLARVRDEAHRFAITYHRKKRSKATLSTTLTGIPGVGPARAKALLNHLGSIARIRAATVEAIAEAPGVSPALARTIRDTLDAEAK